MAKSIPPIEPGLIVGAKYRVGRNIGLGSFGEVYLGTDVTSGEEVAMKFEKAGTNPPQLVEENKAYKILEGGAGVPIIRWFGREESYDVDVMVMERLGDTLEHKFNLCSRRFTLKTVLMLADPMIARVEYLHSKGYLHRDIKPNNFLMGIGPHCNQVYLIDLGLVNRFVRTGQHIPYREGTGSFTGAARFASINNHRGNEYGRRDDLEALGYTLLYFLRGSLPWEGISGKTNEQLREKILEIKLSTSIDVLCKGSPPEFANFLRYCRELPFDARPDYMYLRELFRVLYWTSKYELDYDFDWKRLEQSVPTQGSSVGLRKPQPQV